MKKMKAQAGAKIKAAKAAFIKKNDSIKNAKKAPLGSKPVGRYDLEKNPGEAGKNFGKSDAGYMKPTMGGAKNGGTIKPGKGSTGKKIGKCRGGC
jgi:hypothetical protein